MLIKKENVLMVETVSELEVYKEIEANPILADVLGVLVKQTTKGLAKYPRTVNIEDHSITEWIDHAIQEQIDMIIYLTAMKHKLIKSGSGRND